MRWLRMRPNRAAPSRDDMSAGRRLTWGQRRSRLRSFAPPMNAHVRPAVSGSAARPGGGAVPAIVTADSATDFRTAIRVVWTQTAPQHHSTPAGLWFHSQGLRTFGYRQPCPSTLGEFRFSIAGARAVSRKAGDGSVGDPEPRQP